MITTKYGWAICEWDNEIEKDKCENCGKIPNQIYFRSDNYYDCREGKYWCMSCILKEQKEIDKDLEEVQP